MKSKTFKPDEVTRFLSARDRIIERIGHFRLIDIKSEHLKELTAWLLKQKSARHTKADNPPPVSKAYVHGQLSKLRTVLRWAHKEKMIEQVPLMTLPRADYAKNIPPTPHEIGLLLEHAAPPIRSVIIIGAALGLRVGQSELLALKWSDVDFTLGVLRVSTSNKNPSMPWREVPIRQNLLPMFQEWHTEDQADGTEYIIFYKSKRVGDIKKAWYATLRRAGLADRKIKPYDLRHAFATQLIAAGADIGTVAELMGHSSPAMIYKTYQHVLAKQKKKAVESLPAFKICAKPMCQNKKDSHN